MKALPLLCCLCVTLMAAAAGPPTDPAAMQPRVNTTAPVAPPPAAQPQVSRPPATKAPAKPPESKPSEVQPAANPANAAPGAATAAARRAQDRLELETTQITGNRELPRVMYVVPWKRPDLGDLAGRPANSLLDEVLAPVDRDVFVRQNRYYDALRPDVTESPSAPAAGRPGDEK